MSEKIKELYIDVTEAFLFNKKCGMATKGIKNRKPDSILICGRFDGVVRVTDILKCTDIEIENEFEVVALPLIRGLNCINDNIVYILIIPCSFNNLTLELKDASRKLVGKRLIKFVY